MSSIIVQVQANTVSKIEVAELSGNKRYYNIESNCEEFPVRKRRHIKQKFYNKKKLLFLINWFNKQKKRKNKIFIQNTEHFRMLIFTNSPTCYIRIFTYDGRISLTILNDRNRDSKLQII